MQIPGELEVIFVVGTAERFEDDGEQERERCSRVLRAGDIAYISVVARVSPTPLDARSKRKAQDPRTLLHDLHHIEDGVKHHLTLGTVD